MPQPTQVGPYRLLRRLGAGGMGEVWLGEHVELGIQRALKLLPATLDARLVTRFRREAEAMAALDHPHVARVHALGEHEGRLYLVLDYLPGGDLAARLRDGPLAPAEASALVADLAEGLEYVHQRGVLHRDVKPANVLFDEQGRARWVDFGLAKLAGARSLTETGTMLGTPAYMAPEQATGEHDRVDARADVYGLGALLYHCLTGAPPFSAPSLATLLHQVLEQQPAPPSAHTPGVPAALDAVCLRALAKDPARRYASAAALAAALRAPAAPPASRWLAALALVVVVALAAALATRSERKQTPTTPSVAASPRPTRSSSPANTPQVPQLRRLCSWDLAEGCMLAVAFDAAGKLWVLDDQGVLYAGLPPACPEPVQELRQAFQPEFLRVDAVDGVVAAGVALGLRWRPGGGPPLLLPGFRALARDPRGELVLGGRPGCWRLGANGLLPRPLVRPRPGEAVSAVGFLGERLVVGWRSATRQGGGQMVDPAGRLEVFAGEQLLATRKDTSRVLDMLSLEPGVLLTSVQAGALLRLSWQDGLVLQPWGEGDELGRVLAGDTRGLVCAGSGAGRTVYATSDHPDPAQRRLRGWRWPDGRRVADLSLGELLPRTLSASPRGDWLALGTTGGRLWLYPLRAGAPDGWGESPRPAPPSPSPTTAAPSRARERAPWRLQLEGLERSCVAFSQDGRLWIVSERGRLLSLAPGDASPRLERELHLTSSSLVLWVEGGWILAGQDNSGVLVHPDGRQQDLPAFRCLLPQPDGSILLGGPHGCARLALDAAGSLEEIVPPPVSGVEATALGTLGPRLLVNWGSVSTEFAGQTGHLQAYEGGRKVGDPVSSLRTCALWPVEPDRLLGANSGGALVALRWDGQKMMPQGAPWGQASESEPAWAPALPGSAHGLVCAGPASARFVYAICSGDGAGQDRLRCWRWPAGTLERDLDLDREPRTLALAPGEDWLAVGTREGDVLLFPLEHGAPKGWGRPFQVETWTPPAPR